MNKQKDLAQTGNPKHNIRGRRFLSIALSICMALAMMPAMSITASAATYDIYVGGVQVSDANKDNITGAGISGTVRYNSGTNTLTLDNATITGAYSILLSEGYSAGIWSAVQGLTIEVRGTCIITPPTPSNGYDSCGIFLTGDDVSNILSGDGTLDTRGADARVSYGIVCDGSFIISGPAVTASGGSASYDSYGIHIPYRSDSDSDLTISGSSSVTAVGGNAGSSFYSDGISVGKTLTISGDATVDATGKRGISAINNSSLISGGTVNATGSEVGINTDSNPLSITGGIVTAKGGQKAMSTAPNIGGYAGAVTLTGASESPAQVVAAYTNEKYAKFGTMTTYSVTYDGNGGSGAMTSGTAADGVAFPLPASTFNPPADKAFYKWAIGGTGGTQVSVNGSHTFTGDTTVYPLWKPAAPSAPDMTSGTDSGANSTDNITKDNTPTFSGTAQPNSDISLISSVSGTIGTGTADGSGNWSITASTLADGNHTITAIASDSGISSDPSPGLSITIDTAPPIYSVNIDQTAINNTNKEAMSFEFSGAEMGAAYNYTVTSSGGGGSVTGSGTIGHVAQRITDINIGGLADGTLTLSVTLTDKAGNIGFAATDTVSKDAAAPLGYSINIDQTSITNTNKTAMSFTLQGAEVGGTYNYTVSSGGVPGIVTGSGTIESATQQITGINVGTLADGPLTLSVTLTDTAGNEGSTVTDYVSKDGSVPSGYSINIDQASIDNTNKAAMSFTFASAEVGTTYNYTVSSNGGAGSVTGSGIVGGASQQITGIDITALPDGTLTLSVTLNDDTGNAGTAATDTVGKDTTAPIVNSFSPANSANTVSINADMIITFNEAVTTVAGKNIIIKKTSDNSTVESIDAADIKVTGSGSTTITINPAATLENSTGYYLQIDAGAFKDTNNNNYTGIANTTTWSFTTVSAGGGSSGGGGGGGGSAPPLVTKIESGESVVSTNLDKLVKEGKALTVEGKTGEKLEFDTEALKNIDGQTKDNIKVEIKDVSADYKNEHPDRLIISLTISAGGKHITSFGNGTATVSLPYELKAGEKAADVTVWYLAEDGTMTEVPCTYDAATKMATFKVNHFSLYVVGTADTSKWTNPFSDVKENSWFYDAVRYVSANKMMQGTKDTAFSPNGKTTRGMIVTILWRMENEPKAGKGITFSDVKNGKYYYDAVSWASEKAIVGGYSAEKFGPEDNITREQLSVILYNYAASKGYITGGVSADPAGNLSANLSAFSDSGKIHSWSKDAMSWANAEGLINGMGSNQLDPAGAAQRSQVAAILQRFVENMAK